MWRGKRVAVLFPTFNEKESIRQAIFDFFRSGPVDQIIVVNNNASPGTSEEIQGTGALEIFESKQGYGNALLRGIDHCDAEIIIFAEPDGTFLGLDVLKLLTYSDDKPVVFGTRTSREFIWDGANMGRLLKWGNWAVAKMTEILFNTTLLTDMGCTLRLFTREALQRIRPHLTVGNSHFGAQLLMETIVHRIPFVEIPVNYRQRVGFSMATGNQWKAISIGIQMILLVWKYRLGFHKGERKLWTNDFHPHPLAERPLGEIPRLGECNGCPIQGTNHGKQATGLGV